MKKLFMALALLSACAMEAKAEDDPITYQALWWQVKAEDQSMYGASSFYLYAKIDGTDITINGSYADITEKLSDRMPFVGTEGWDWDGNNPENATFYAELWNESYETLVTSEGVSYAALVSYMDTNWRSGKSTQALSPYTFTFPIPEPTSGVLFLIGVAGLALKRKRLS